MRWPRIIAIKLNISEERKERLKQLDYNNRLAVVRALREKQELENYQSHPSAEALKREASALHKAMQSKTEQEPNEQTNQQSDEKTHPLAKNDTNENSTSSALLIAKKSKEYKESSKFNQLIGSVFQEEGGYEDNLKKIDQPTNMGITQSTLDNFNKAHPHLKIDKKLKDISKEDAELIYKLDYYDHYRLEKINNLPTTRTMFHMFINSAPTKMALIVQQSINSLGEKIDIDGIIGSETINAINRLIKSGKSQELNRKLIELRLKYEDKLSDNKKYPGRRKRFERLLEE